MELLEVADRPGEVVTGLVARAVGNARVEEQRAGREAADQVDDPGAHVGLDLPDRAVRPDRHVVPLAPLVVDRGFEAEGARAPARVETDRVAILVERRVAPGDRKSTRLNSSH